MAFPGLYNFNYYKGDTFEFVIRPKNPNGANFDLTGYTAEFVIATSRGDNPTSRYEADAVVNAVSDIVTCTILPAIGSEFEAGSYVYDVQISSSAEVVYTLLTGTITVTEQVTGAE